MSKLPMIVGAKYKTADGYELELVQVLTEPTTYLMRCKNPNLSAPHYTELEYLLFDEDLNSTHENQSEFDVLVELLSEVGRWHSKIYIKTSGFVTGEGIARVCAEALDGAPISVSARFWDVMKASYAEKGND